MKKKRTPMHFRNRSPYGWYIASYIERFEYEDEDKQNLSRRCKAWENTIILKARNREHAYRKVMKLGKIIEGKAIHDQEEGTGRKIRMVFEGLTRLLPIHDELEDYAEVIWSEYKGRAVKTVQSWVKQKHELEVFNDEPEAD